MASLGKPFGAIIAAFMFAATGAAAQEVKHYRFAYDQPKTTGYGILGDIFAEKLKTFSKGTMLIDQYPGAQLGQEPQVLQLVKSGDVEFCISSSANAATLSPQAGVMSMHFLFRSEAHLIKALADPEVSKAVKAMIADTVQGARVIGLATLGLRHMYARREIRKIEDNQFDSLGDQGRKGNLELIGGNKVRLSGKYDHSPFNRFVNANSQRPGSLGAVGGANDTR